MMTPDLCDGLRRRLRGRVPAPRAAPDPRAAATAAAAAATAVAAAAAAAVATAAVATDAGRDEGRRARRAHRVAVRPYKAVPFKLIGWKL